MGARKVGVLLISHYRDLSEVLEMSLTYLGYEVVAHARLEAALAALAAGLEVDVALVDLTMPREAAAGLVAALQASTGGRLPVVGMTSLEGTITGVFHMLEKPFELDVLDAQLVAAVRRPQPRSAP